MSFSMRTTGERLIPGSSDPDLLNEHVARYKFAEQVATGKRVLDAGCGEGYGAASLAKVAAAVFALDRAADAVRRGRDAYPGVAFARGDCEALPFAEGSLDLVVAFEVIEHLADWASLVRESARVLTRSGVFLVSTPNRPYYQSTRTEPNPYHVREFDHAEFRSALEETFEHCDIYTENHAPAIALRGRREATARAHFESPPDDPQHAHFLLGVCSMDRAPPLRDLAFVADSGNVLRDRESHIAKQDAWIATLEKRHAEVEGNMSRELSRLPYRVLRWLRLAPRLPDRWAE